jgi:hypothetical protein
MSAERLKILEMLEQGKISADEAASLLDAVPEESSLEQAVPAEQPRPEGPAPDMDHFRRLSQIPLIISASVLALIGAGLYTFYRYSEGQGLAGLLCLWSLFVIAALATLLSFIGMRAPWLHVRVQERDGTKVSISLPLPLPLLRLSMHIARGHVGQDTAAHLDTAETFLKAVWEQITTSLGRRRG